MRHIPKQLIQLANALLDIPDLSFAFDNQRVLKVDFVLGGEAELFLLLLLAEWGAAATFARG